MAYLRLPRFHIGGPGRLLSTGACASRAGRTFAEMAAARTAPAAPCGKLSAARSAADLSCADDRVPAWRGPGAGAAVRSCPVAVAGAMAVVRPVPLVAVVALPGCPPLPVSAAARVIL